ncbi:MAG: hypothetical protein SGJ17_03025 [Hyphomicrobiales bacterium]|nr:hypothetical protein [Hyphomicrobiales bacterium]
MGDLKKIHESESLDVGHFAEAIEQFGLLEISLIAQNAKHRMAFLNALEILILNPNTLEKDVHRSIDKTLWVLGNKYSIMSSNKTLRRIILDYTHKKFSGDRSSKRPDLLLATDITARHLLIEFKRPSHILARADEAQASEYRDALSAHLPVDKIDVILLGGKIDSSLNPAYSSPSVKYKTYNELLSEARAELNWLLKELGN